MPGIDTKILPLLPLTTGVVLPGMVLTLTLESEEAKRAVAAAREADGTILLVPKAGGSYARIGTVAKVEDVGLLPSGMDALVIRGTGRARVGLGVPGTGEATWVQIEAADEENSDTRRARELAREYRATVEGIVEARGVSGVA
ncbi:MAG: LON peptidase substrate-binding domain-containing protein, partial [Actinomycetota bacterium]|nr:LON peptidase substrate-binding domain-containing protein [Actinomycetota bacterium]